MAYHDTDMELLSGCCEGCRLSGIAEKLDTLVYDLNSGVGYSGTLLSEAEIAYLNGMCVATANLGTILNGILTASQEYEPATLISAAVKESLNNCCLAFSTNSVGDVIDSCVTLINSFQEYDEGFIKSLYFTGFEDYPAVIDDEDEIITVDLPYNAVASALVVNFTASAGSSVLSGETILESGVSEIDFTSPVTLSCISKDESVSLDYVTTVNVIPNDEAEFLTFGTPGITGAIDDANKAIEILVPFGSDLSLITLAFTASENAKVYNDSDVEVTSPIEGFTYTIPFEMSVVSEDESVTNVYTIEFSELPNTDSTFQSFTLVGTSATINNELKTISVETPAATDLSSLAATFTVPLQAKVYVNDVEQTSGESLQSFVNPITYRVVAGNLSYTDYVVTATVAGG